MVTDLLLTGPQLGIILLTNKILARAQLCLHQQLSPRAAGAVQPAPAEKLQSEKLNVVR